MTSTWLCYYFGWRDWAATSKQLVVCCMGHGCGPLDHLLFFHQIQNTVVYQCPGFNSHISHTIWLKPLNVFFFLFFVFFCYRPCHRSWMWSCKSTNNGPCHGLFNIIRDHCWYNCIMTWKCIGEQPHLPNTSMHLCITNSASQADTEQVKLQEQEP